MRRSHIRKVLAAQAVTRVAQKAARHQDNVCRWWSVELQFAFKRTAFFQQPLPEVFRNAREWWASRLLVKGAVSYLDELERGLFGSWPAAPVLYLTPAVAAELRKLLSAETGPEYVMPAAGLQVVEVRTPVGQAVLAALGKKP